MMYLVLRILALVGALGLAAPSFAQQVQPDTQDLFKQAGNFLANCDARANEAGVRPEENFMCLSFVAGMIEGYNYGAVANGNPQPYCLLRPTSLVELMDMMATVIERGVPPDMPSAAVFHFIMDRNFPCAEPEEEAAAEGQPETTTETTE